MKLLTCPICKKKYLKTGIKNHIINSAKGEIWRRYLRKGRNIKHAEYYKQNFQWVKIKKLII